MKSFLMVIMFLAVANFSFAQNEIETTPEPIQIEAAGDAAATGTVETADDAEYSYGTIKQATAEQISVLEYDYDGEQTVEITYKITPDTQYENIAAATELAEGDNVEIYFKRENDNRLITRLVKENMEEFLDEDVGNNPAEEAPAAAPVQNP